VQQAALKHHRLPAVHTNPWHRKSKCFTRQLGWDELVTSVRHVCLLTFHRLTTSKFRNGVWTHGTTVFFLVISSSLLSYDRDVELLTASLNNLQRNKYVTTLLIFQNPQQRGEKSPSLFFFGWFCFITLFRNAYCFQITVFTVGQTPY
jgi:hypothetical protein